MNDRENVKVQVSDSANILLVQDDLKICVQTRNISYLSHHFWKDDELSALTRVSFTPVRIRPKWR